MAKRIYDKCLNLICVAFSKTSKELDSNGPKWIFGPLCEDETDSGCGRWCQKENQDNQVNIESDMEWDTRLVRDIFQQLS